MSGSIFDLAEFKPYLGQWVARSQELRRRRSYYDGSIYRKMQARLGWLSPRIYKGAKALYLPLSRAVDVDAGIIPSGWSLPPGAPEAQRAAMETVLGWSYWDVEGVLYVHYGAMYGVAALKVADLREAGRVVIKPVDPSCLLLANRSDYGALPELAIWVEERMSRSGERCEYAEIITAETVRVFLNGEPAELGVRPAEYTNTLGAVPFVEVRHIETGAELGEATFQKAIPLLDEVNELASYLADIIRKHAEPQWAVLGAEPGDLEHSGANVWFIPAGGDAKILVPQIDIDGVLDFIREVRDQVYGALPELSFDELRKKQQIATATLELQLMELVIKVKRSRPNYDAGLVTALRLAGEAAGDSLGLPGLGVLADSSFRLDPARPILPVLVDDGRGGARLQEQCA